MVVCRKCGAGPHDGGVWLERVNEKGVPGVWECRPRCGAALSPDEAVVGAIVGEPAAMPPVEVGDWVLGLDEEIRLVLDGPRSDGKSRVDYWGWCHTDIFSEIRKANGVIWRRTDRKEPTE